MRPKDVNQNAWIKTAKELERIETFLSATRLFDSLDSATMRTLAQHMSPLNLPAGRVLMHEGEVADALYIIVSGRLRVLVSKQPEEIVAEVGRGETVGEMGLISDSPRSATVQAIRDSQLLALPKEAFRNLIEARPEALTGITRLVISRLQRSVSGNPVRRAALGTVAIVPAGLDPAPLEQFGEQLTEAMNLIGPTTLLNQERLDSQLRHLTVLKTGGDRTLIQRRKLGPPGQSGADAGAPPAVTDSRVTEWLHNLEASQDFVVYLADAQFSPWTERCIGQADRVLLLGRANGRPELGEVEAELARRDRVRRRNNPRWTEDELVLLHGRSTEYPTGTIDWLKSRRVVRHHHVRMDVDSDFDRLARMLTGTHVSLVLGGGGARGMAHIGVLKALEELDIPIDMVGGTSFGAMIAAGVAMRWNSAWLRLGVKEGLVDGGKPTDLTAPFSALLRGAKVARELEHFYHDLKIEDTWLPFFCMSSNLTRGSAVIHASGGLRKAVRTSIALPGILPPMRSDDGDVLVDGGVMNNLPVDVMRNRAYGGRIIAVNLRADAQMSTDELNDAGVMSGWRLFLRKFNPFSRNPSVPSLVEVALRTAETGNLLSSQMQESAADLTLHPDVAAYGMLEFTALDKLIAAGHREAHAQLIEFARNQSRRRRPPRSKAAAGALDQKPPGYRARQ